MFTPHSASLLGENAFFGVRFFCLRHSFANCSFCICVNTCRFSVCACCFLVDFSVHSNHLDFLSETLELFRGSVSGLYLRGGSVSGLSLRSGSDPVSLFATRSRPLASRLFECCDENSVSVLDCLLWTCGFGLRDDFLIFSGSPIVLLLVLGAGILFSAMIKPSLVLLLHRRTDHY